MKTDKILKLKLVKIWEILSQETDEDHPMGTTALLSKLKELGIDCDRRTLYADIDALNECGYEILCRRSTSNMYYVMDRKFSVGEIRIMMDAVQAASFVTEKKTNELVDKISHLAGSKKAEVLKQNIVTFALTKRKTPQKFNTKLLKLLPAHALTFLWLVTKTKVFTVSVQRILTRL